jgi:hypothetical protein
MVSIVILKPTKGENFQENHKTSSKSEFFIFYFIIETQAITQYNHIEMSLQYLSGSIIFQLKLDDFKSSSTGLE